MWWRNKQSNWKTWLLEEKWTVILKNISSLITLLGCSKIQTPVFHDTVTAFDLMSHKDMDEKQTAGGIARFLDYFSLMQSITLSPAALSIWAMIISFCFSFWQIVEFVVQQCYVCIDWQHQWASSDKTCEPDLIVAFPFGTNLVFQAFIYTMKY